MSRRAIVWFRNDLRLHDNQVLHEAMRNADEIIPVYIFDERIFKGQTSFGFDKTGKFRAQFIIEAIHDLRRNLATRGSKLIVRVGKPEDILSDIAKQAQSSWVFCNRERTQEEVRVQDAVEKKLWQIGQEIRYERGKMLYYTADLPFPVSQTPETFAIYRKEVERITRVREPLPAPDKIPGSTFNMPEGEIPTVTDFGHTPFEIDARSTIQFKGGETEGLARLKYYLWDSDLIKTYEETRNGLIGSDYSSKLSVYLSTGCLSPKKIYHELKKYENERGENKSTYWLFFELLWRDYFRLVGKKYGNAIFQIGGLNGNVDKTWRIDENVFKIWSEAKTGVPFIDANMRELNSTGFMSNRGRQNTASFLVKDLKINWLMGASWFESKLIDYDSCSNYCNWLYVAGVGIDPRENRYFNILNQALRYDPSGEYIKLWLPELAKVPQEKIHRPDVLSTEEQKQFNVKIGTQYPKAVIDTAKWL